MTDPSDRRDPSGLPRSLELLWGVHEPTARGPKPGLSIGRIVTAAIELADADGLDALSMARIARHLGFTTMSLYRYVASKDELLMLVTDAAFGPPPVIDGIGRAWRRDFEQLAWAHLEAFRRHPWALKIPIYGVPVTPNQLGWLDAGLQALERTGLTDDEKANVFLLLSGFVRNDANLAADLALAATASTGVHPGDYGRVLGRVVDAERFPALHRALAAGIFDDGEPGWGDAEFDFGLQRVLDGIEVFVNARRPRRAKRS